MINELEKEKKNFVADGNPEVDDQDIKRQISELQSELKRNTETIENLKNSNLALLVKLQEIEIQIDNLKSGFSESSSATKKQLKDLENERDNVQKEINSLTAKIPAKEEISHAQDFINSKAYM